MLNRKSAIALFVTSIWSFAMAAEILAKPRLTLVGHATVLIEGSQATFLTDPFFKNTMLWLKRRIPPAMQVKDLPPIDVVLVSHTHPDHFDLEAIKAMNPRPVVVMPWGRGRRLKKLGFEVVNLRPGEAWTYKNVKITAVQAEHNAWHNLGYLVDMDRSKVYFTGDTEYFKNLAKLKEERIDIMLMPYDGTPVIGNIWTMKKAAEAVKVVGPRICVPIHTETFRHWLTGQASTPPSVFIDRLKTACPETQGLLLKPGESIPLTLENIHARWAGGAS